MRHHLLILAICTSGIAPAFDACAGPKDDLIAADKSFSALSAKEGSNAAFLAYLADDGRLFGTGNETPILGKAEAAKRFADPTSGNGDPAKNVLSWTPDNAEVSTDGSLGYTDGHWLFQGMDPKGAAIHLTGHYVTVWRHGVGGNWKVAADMGTTDPQAAR